MNDKIQELKNKAWDMIMELKEKRSSERLEKLYAVIKKLDELTLILESVDIQVRETQANLDSMSHPPSKKLKPEQSSFESVNNTAKGDLDKEVLIVQVDWDLNGKPLGKDYLWHYKSSVGLAKVIERLVEVLGEKVLEVGSGFRVPRGPLLSKNPNHEYSYNNGKKVYSHHPIGDSGYFVLTNTPTSQKVSDMEKFLRRLKLVPGSFRVWSTNSSWDLVV